MKNTRLRVNFVVHTCKQMYERSIRITALIKYVHANVF